VLEVLSVTLPVFAVIALGFGIVRLGPFSAETMRGLGAFTLNVTLPCALFNAIASRDFGEVVNPSYLLALASAGLVTQLFMWIAARIQGAGPKRRSLSVLAAATPNTAFLGYPIFLLVIPEHAAAVVAMNLLIENILLTPIGLTLLGSVREGNAARPAPLALAGQIILSVLRRPLIIGLCLGFISVLLGIDMPEVVDRFTGLVGQAASPVALIVIGGGLVGLNLQGDLKLASLITSVKLMVHPAMVFVALSVLTSFGVVTLGPELVTGLILTGCLPMFAIFALFGQEAGHEGLASLSVMLATCLSFLTINIALVLLI
jgi:hypothetical protein